MTPRSPKAQGGDEPPRGEAAASRSRPHGTAVVIGIIVFGIMLIAVFRVAGNRFGGSVTSAAERLTDDPSLVDVGIIIPSPREEVPSALDDRTQDAFPAPLIDPGEIRSGGPPPDGIPPIDEPLFENVGSVDWLEDREPVIALGDRAYPVRILTQHELVNDNLDGRPITVSYCPLCNSAVAYDRELPDGRILDFGTSGSLYNSSLVMYDRQTESLWTHFDGRAVIGVLTGTQLELIPMSTVSWADFRTAHPEGLVLSEETGFSRRYGSNPYAGYDDERNSPFLFRGDADPRLPPMTRVLGVRADDDWLAIRFETLEDERTLSFPSNGVDLVAFWTPGTASALDSSAVSAGRDVGATGVFERRIEGELLSFEPAAEVESNTAFTDLETGSTWDIFGRATAGPLAGTQLEAIEHLDTFWFALAAFGPDTQILG